MTLEDAQVEFLKKKAVYAVTEAYRLGVKAGKKTANEGENHARKYNR